MQIFDLFEENGQKCQFLMMGYFMSNSVIETSLLLDVKSVMNLTF